MTTTRYPHPNVFTGVRHLPSGKFGAFVDGILTSRHATQVDAQEAVDYYGDEPEAGTCTICDAVGHGYPGAGPCPLEETGEEDPQERLLWALEDERLAIAHTEAEAV